VQQFGGRRTRVINRGLFVRHSIAGIEPDSFVILMVVIGLTVIPTQFRWAFDIAGLVELVVGYTLLRLLYQYEPRAFVKYRNFNTWRGVFRAKPPMIAGIPRPPKRNNVKV
jgi:hypothetical protein